VIYLDVKLSSIPTKALKTERRSDMFRSAYYKVDMEAVVELQSKVVVKLVCGGRTLITRELDMK
jgi:hypothetical protein